MLRGFFVAGCTGFDFATKTRTDVRQMTILHRFQAAALMWAVTITLMIIDDAAMLAMMFC